MQGEIQAHNCKIALFAQPRGSDGKVKLQVDPDGTASEIGLGKEKRGKQY